MAEATLRQRLRPSERCYGGPQTPFAGIPDERAVPGQDKTAGQPLERRFAVFVQAVQIIGALLVLLGFVLAQRGLVQTDSPSYLVANLLGSSILAAIAVFPVQWGFLLLEGVWAIVSAWSLVRLLTRATTPDGA